MLILLAAVFLAIHVDDLALTLRGVVIGKKERNPLARWLMRHMGLVQGLMFVKLASLTCFFLLAARVPPMWQAVLLAVGSLLGLAVVVNNMRVLQRAKKRRS